MKRPPRISILIAGILSLTSISPIAWTLAQEDSQTFPETGYTVRGRFLQYWRDNGGLRQQGYPISTELQEVSPINGRTYNMQYFERAVFELHPENKPPYDVLLSLLGTLQYQQKYPNSASGQKPNMSEGSVLFPQTGKRVGGSFLAYWNMFGGLRQQGFPISDEIQEVSPLNGKTYTVQYFERAVMEWHPGSTPPSDVLLSHLGKFRYDQIYDSTPHLIAKAVLGDPLVVGNYLFWVDEREGRLSIRGYDWSAKREFIVKPALALGASSLSSDGSMVAWVEGSDKGDMLRGYDLIARREFTITDTLGNELGGTALYRNVLYYQDARGIVSRALTNGSEQVVAAKGRNPIALDDVLLWTEENYRGEFVPPNATLHMLPLDSSIGERSVIASVDNVFSRYDVSGGRVVWAGINERKVHLLSISTGEDKVLSTADAFSPRITGNLVTWTELVGGKTALKLHDIATGRTTNVQPALGQSGDIVAQGVVAQKTLVYTLSTTPSSRSTELHAVDLLIAQPEQ